MDSKANEKKRPKEGGNPSKKVIFILGALGILFSLAGLVLFRLFFWLGALLLVLAFVFAILYIQDNLRAVEARVEKLEGLLKEEEKQEPEGEEDKEEDEQE